MLSRHFTALDSRPPRVLDLGERALSKWQRTLLVSDGTLTTLVEALELETIEVRDLEEYEEAVTDDRCDALDLPRGAVALRRLVTLCGSSTGTPFIEGDTTIVTSRLPPAFLDALHREPRGLGAALKAAGVVVRKELLWGGWLRGEEPLLTRTHRLSIGALPVFLVSETFLPSAQAAA
jgi:chorismate-pyruvate lyase